jgi:predicted GNAT superfamily acetyltransferase
MTTSPLVPATPETATADARRAAEDAGVRIVGLQTSDDVRRIQPVIEAVWGASDVPPPNLLRGIAHAGAVMLAAEPLDTAPGEATCGFAFGFLGWHGGLHLHSHQVAVLPGLRSRGVGYALKLAQRSVCLDEGVTECRWTFDPLMLRNARFNFLRFGVRAVSFLPDCYGRMGDTINGDDVSDRFEVSWRLDDQLRPRTAEADTPLITIDDDGYPRRTSAPVGPGAGVAIPAGYAQLRAAADPRAALWRSMTRQVFLDCFDAGLVAAAIGSGGYRFDFLDQEGR